MPASPEDFRSALSQFASGVTVVTTRDAHGKKHGITVSAFCSVSLEPPMVLICIEKSTGSHYAFGESGAFVVNILASSQSDVSEHFASRVDEKFGDVEHTLNEDGVPVLTDAIATLRCTLRHSLDGGDHSIFVGLVESVEVKGGSPLIYFDRGYHELQNK
ncbi:MAG TPA: flavin reductase family protein [Pyrinomonadaceae bacterium]|nr:flavin reductase family protein [Pyrinomonadaceae bacterium]